LIIVTGGAGFIGSNLVKALNQAGENDILIVDRLGCGQKWQNLSDLDFLDYEHKEDFARKLDQGLFDHGVWAIFHMGACSSTTEKDADYLMENNYEFSRKLALRFASKPGLRFIYASSAATYGDGSSGYMDNHDDIKVLKPLNMYGYSKQLFDLWALRTGFIKNSAGLKFFNVFGPNEYHKKDMRSVVIRAYYQIKKASKVKLFRSYRQDFKDGEQRRDFIYVKDAVKIALFFLENPHIQGVFNAGTGIARSFKDLALGVFSAMGLPPEIEYIDMPDGLEKRYQYFTESDTGKLRRNGFQDEFMSLENAVHDYVVNHLQMDQRTDDYSD
jgi:ADP-L-glycero-D-manno-heptose 6-epimerase